MLNPLARSMVANAWRVGVTESALRIYAVVTECWETCRRTATLWWAEFKPQLASIEVAAEWGSMSLRSLSPDAGRQMKNG